jgi:hypothetical protein
MQTAHSNYDNKQKVIFLRNGVQSSLVLFLEPFYQKDLSPSDHI